MTRAVLALLALFVAAPLALALIGHARWRAAGDATVAAMDAAAPDRPAPSPYDPSQLAGVPAPARRFFAWALVPGQRHVARVSFAQQGDFAMRPDAWTHFTATQHVTVAPRATQWLARMRMAAVVPVLVRDSYLDGAGSLRATLLGWLPVADAHGTPQMASGALLRWLAEATWYPTALLPTAGAQWSPVDDSTARVTITDRGTTVALDVTFAPDGPITTVRADRWNEDRRALRPWRGTFTDWRRVDGIMIPLRGEVGWGDGADYRAYWRGTLADVRYAFVAGAR